MADGQVCWCELAFLLTTQRKLYDRRAGALSSSRQKSRIARPTLPTIEKYAVAVRAFVEIRVRTGR
jgi:hypothetical protein